MCLVCGVGQTFAQNITYTRADSLNVVALLRDGARQPEGTNLMLYYGMRLRGVPYVAHTLEVNKTERLVVNLRQMDCTTFVETVFALALTTRNGSVKWADYCRFLERIRYSGGMADGYSSRNHYFMWWTENNKTKGLVSLPLDDLAADSLSAYPYLRRQTIRIDYMTTHTSAYKMLKGNAADIAKIAKLERETGGKVMMYIPAASTGLPADRLKCVRDGDILAIATKKKGLDTTHIGIASWNKKDGRLHLLNASQIHKKVVLEPKTLRKYMSEHPSQLGIWVIRPIL